MADIETDDDIERDDDFGVVDDDQDELRAVLRRAMHSGSDDPDPASDDFDLDPLPDQEITTISPDEGLKLIDKANQPGAKRKDADPPEAEEPAAAQAEAAPEKADAPAEKDETGETEAAPAPAEPKSDLDSLLEGIDPERAGKIRERMAGYEGLDEVFASNKDVLNAISQGEGGPAKAISNLLGLHQYANKNPDQYLAWAATQLGSDPEAVIIKAAEHLGLKVTKPEADPFEDEEIKKLREENRTLKSQGRRLPFGPDVQSPQDQLGAFATEKNPDGTLKRPFWDNLHPQVAQRATDERARTGHPVTIKDLDRFYREAEDQMRGLFTPAAPPPPVVAQVAQTPAAPETNGKISRAQAASKQLDGSGQGADRHSAPPDGADLRGTIAHFLRQAR
ncbi:hypothetical protein [Pseudogemmobacter sonorensis]|uniref:hypothetical protein n=1 Tax=Pseudogemmobacter sonorensis TaxID=2989681 RepID=UPI00368516EB